MVGALAGLNIMALKPNRFEDQLKRMFEKKNLDLNVQAFETGLRYDFGQSVE
jgi:Pyruvate/2-oxoacid:ferredoxin oxidoreductase gamma subunit